MAYTKVVTSFNLSQEFTDKAVTSKKALAKFARKKRVSKDKSQKQRKS